MFNAIEELLAVQLSIDNTPPGKPLSEALIVLASCTYDTIEVLEYFEGTEELPEVLRGKLVELMSGMHHMLLSLYSRDGEPKR